jgi:hypothetical protein
MRRIEIVTVVALNVLAATAAFGQDLVDLSGPYRCLQHCAGPSVAFVTQNGRELNLTNEVGQLSRAWIDRPGHIWTQSWNEGAAYSADGMTLQFDRGSVWQRDLQNKPYVVVPRRADVAVPPTLSPWEVYQSLRRPYLCYLPSEPCDNTQRLTN